jgi:hypothetical protein
MLPLLLLDRHGPVPIRFLALLGRDAVLRNVPHVRRIPIEDHPVLQRTYDLW